MSNAKRKGIIFSGDQFGKATFAFDDLIGDISTPESLRLEFENNLTKIKGSSIFADYDVNQKDPMNEDPSNRTTFDLLDIPNYAIGGGSFNVNKNAQFFSNSGSWHPQRFSPPSPEGWEVYDYNAFSNYIPKYNSSGASNSNYIIYNTLYEVGSGIARTTYDYPVRWNGTDYERVPLFNHACWVSLANIGNTDITNIRVVIPKINFDGCIDINPKTNAPNDLMIYSHSNLISNGITYPLTLSGTMGVEGSSDELEPLAFEVYESDPNSDFTKRNRDYYTFNIDIPNTYTMDINDWLHLAFYWGSNDNYISSLKQTYTKPTVTPYELYADQENLNYYVWGRNSFFNKRIGSGIGLTKSGINDLNIYFYNQNNSNHPYYEQKYTIYNQPFRYKLNETIEGSSTGKTNSLLGYKSIENENFIPVLLVCKNDGYFYDEPELELEFIFGEPIHHTEAPNSWADFDFYPELKEDYNIIAKLICSYSFDKYNIPVYKSVDEYLSNTNSIVFIDMIAENIFKEPLGDVDISSAFLNAFNTLIPTIRTKGYLEYFRTNAKNILARFLRMNLNQFVGGNNLGNNNTLRFSTFHNLAKYPSDELVKVAENVEPKGIQFINKALNLINDFASISTSKNIAGFGSTNLYFSNIKLDHDTEFEIYLERSYDEFFNHLYDDAHGLSRDYTFKIKFENILNEYTIKNLFLNASKYVLSEIEYQKRITDNLSVEGYFSAGIFTSISDYNLHSDAALIPDLKRETYRQIVNKQNSPEDANRFTETQFEDLKRSINPNITKDELIAEKASFGLTSSFYEIDISKPSDKYRSINDLGLTVSNYTLSDLYWLNNIDFLYGENPQEQILNAKHVKDLRADSFIITGTGYTTNNGTINLLENITDQQLLSSTGSTINQRTQANVQRITQNKIAIKIICDESQTIKGFKLKLKNSSNYYNYHAKINCEIYSNKNDKPDQILAKGSEIYLNQITHILDDYYFYIDYRFYKDKTYWLVLNTSQLPPLYEPNIKGLINVNGTGVTGVYNPNNNTFSDFEIYNTGIDFGIGSTVGSEISNWYSISSIASSTFMTVANTGTTADNQNYSLRYFYGLGVKESSLTGAPNNTVQYFTGVGWSDYSGTAFIEFYKPDVEVYASFNKNYENSNLILPPPNKYRETDNLKVGEYWSFNCKKFETPKILKIYPRSVSLNKIEVLGSGTNGSNIVSIAATNYNEKILSGLAISQSTYFAAGTSITNIYYNSSNDTYSLIMSSNNLQTFTNQTVGIGTSGNIYAKRANDIHLTLNYDTGGSIASTTITLDKSPTWTTKFYSKSSSKYKHLQKELKSDLITATHDLYFENQSVIGATSYINGYSIGIFNPLSSVGFTIDFKFISSGGVRVFVNDGTLPSLDKWTVSAATGYSFTHTLAEISEETKLEVQFNHNKTAAGTAQTIIGYWKRSDNNNWQIVNDSFYIDNSLQPYTIDTRLIRNLTLLNVSKSLADLQAPNFGSPLNDILVIRSI